jgi:uncharacterized protein YcbX
LKVAFRGAADAVDYVKRRMAPLPSRALRGFEMHDAIEVGVQSLHLYPVKSCAGVRVDRLRFDDKGGLVGDREWAVVDAMSELVWQGSHPRLALVVPGFDGATLTLGSAAADHQVRPVAAVDPCEVRIWNAGTARHDTFSARDGGDAAADFLSKIVGAPLRLVHLGARAQQRQDASPVHVVSTSSMAELNETLARHALPAAAVERLRPNVVIAGAHESLLPFLEEHVTEMRWASDQGVGSLRAFQPCISCIVPNVDATGVPADGVLEAMTRLSAQRHPGHPVCFGVYARPGGVSTLRAGALIEATVVL